MRRHGFEFDEQICDHVSVIRDYVSSGVHFCYGCGGFVTRADERYVVGLALSVGMGYVALIRKIRPGWQHNRLNGPGGQINPDESPLDAMKREWAEETRIKLPTDDWVKFARLWGAEPTRAWEVHFFWNYLPDDTVTGVNYGRTDEHVEIYPLSSIDRQPLVTHIRWLIEAAVQGIKAGTEGVILDVREV